MSRKKKEPKVKTKLLEELSFTFTKYNTENTIKGLILTSTMFILHLTSSTFLTETQKWLEHFPGWVIQITILTSFCMNCIFALSIFSKIWINSQESLNFQDLLIMTRDFLENFLHFNFDLIDTIFLPLKMILLTSLLFSNNVADGVHLNNPYLKILFFSLILSDIGFTIAMSYFKVEFFREFYPKHKDFFGKIPGSFEKVLLLAIVLNPFATYRLYTAGSLRTIAYCFRFLIFASVNFVYFWELPFFEKDTEKVYGYSIVIISSFSLIHDFFNSDFNSSLKVFMFVLPLTLVVLKTYLARVYNAIKNFDEIEKNIKLLVKRTIISEHDKQKNFATERRIMLAQLNTENLQKKILKREKEELTEEDLDLFIMKKYEEFNPGNYALFLQITWYLDNNFKVARVTRLLESMLLNRKNMMSKWLFLYSKNEVSHKIKEIQKKNELCPNELVKRNNYADLEKNLKKINHKKLKFSKVFYYKKKLKNFSQKIENYDSRNLTFINILASQTCNLKNLNLITKTLYHLHEKIKFDFAEIEKFSEEKDIAHLSLYHLYLHKCANLHRQASEIYKIYKKRFVEKKKLVNIYSTTFKDSKDLSTTLIFKIEVSERNFGTVMGIYGNSKLLKNGKNLGSYQGQNMNCFISDNLVKPHQEAARKIMNEDYTDKHNKEKFVFFKDPDTGFIHPTTVKIMLMPPSINNDICFATGIKFHKADRNYYITLDQTERITGFSQNFQNLFEFPENYLSYQRLKELSVDAQRLVMGKHDLGMEIEEGSEDLSLGSGNKKIHNTIMSVHGKQIEKKIGKNICLKFTNRVKQKPILIDFQAEVLEQKWYTIDFSYKYLKLNMIDNNIGQGKIAKIHRNNRRVESILVENKKFLKKSSLRKSSQNAGIESSNQEQILEEEKNVSTNQIFDKKSYSEEEESLSSKEGSDLTSSILDNKRAMLGTGSVFSNNELQTHKKYYAFEDAIKKKPLMLNIFMVFLGYLGSLGVIIYITLLLEDELGIAGTNFEGFNDIYSIVYEHSFEVSIFYSKILSAVAYQKNYYSKTRYDNFDLAVQNWTYFPFNEFEKFEDGNHSSEFADENELMESIPSINVGIDPKSDGTVSYLKYELEVSQRNLQRLGKKMNNYIGNFGDNNKKLFDFKIDFLETHVNGSIYEKSMSIYQGYWLFSIVKAKELLEKNFNVFNPEKKDRNLLYFLENSLNGFLVAVDKFLDNIFIEEKNQYLNFNDFVYQCMFVILGLTAISMIFSIYSVLKLRRTFFKIYQSFLKQTEGEVEERINQLESIKLNIDIFKYSGFYKNLFTVKEINNKTFNKKNRRTRKLSHKDYCFRLVFSLFAIGFFYIAQICFGTGMMMIYRDNIKTGIWIVEKQNEMMIMAKEQLLFYNMIKQRLIIGSDSSVHNKPIDEYLGVFIEQMKKDSSRVMKIFEKASEGETHDEKFEAFLVSNINTTVCSFIDQMRGREELCKTFDRKIPQKGIIQVYFRLFQYYTELKIRIETVEDLNPRDILDDPEFIQMEVTYENIYYWSFVAIATSVDDYIENYAFETAKELVNFIVKLMIIFIIMSFFFILYSFVKIVIEVKITVFSFRLLSLNCVVNNASVKHCFLKVYKLNQKHF